jgi:hypothetical protein
MSDRHADDWAMDALPVHRMPGAAVPPAPDFVPVSQPVASVGWGLAGVLVCGFVLLALLATLLVLVAVERHQRAAQVGAGLSETRGLADRDGSDRHVCEDTGHGAASHREWARLPHDGGRP